jgi:hypothetical protein
LKTIVVTLVALACALAFAQEARADDPGRIDAYVSPYYDSSGPIIRIGEYSSGLASKNRQVFVATILRMKKSWGRLSFLERYVAAARLYDLGFRNEATYWFYSAQYTGRQFGSLVDQKSMGGMGSPAFELYHAQGAFLELVGPDVNGYAFGDVGALVKIIRRVQSENRTVPDLRAIYSGVAFIGNAQWQHRNAEINAGLGTLAASLDKQGPEIARERVENGTQTRFAQLTSTPFPGGY